MSCQTCNSSNEGLFGQCKNCQARRTKRVRASIRNKFYQMNQEQSNENDKNEQQMITDFLS